jgi:hypothetical protein
MQPVQKLGEILVGLKLLSRFDVGRVLEAMRRLPPAAEIRPDGPRHGLLGEEHILAALAVQMHLLPGIGRLSLPQILDQLRTAEALA